MRRLFPLLVLAAWAALADPLFAQGAVVGSPEFSPPVFLPGEVVTLVATIDPGNLSWEASTIQSGFAEPGESGPQLLSVALEERKNSPLLMVRFVAWHAGPGYLPEMTIGRLVIPRIRFECQSALSDGNLKAPVPLPQLDLPGLYTSIYVLAGVLLIALVLGIMMVTRTVPWFKALQARRAYARVRREFDELLNRLARTAAGPDVWAELCAGLRKFASSRMDTDLSALTASEVLALPAGTVPGDAGVDLAGILAMGDEVRFAGNQHVQSATGIERARSVADRIDEASYDLV